jgi:hypothetical protein
VLSNEPAREAAGRARVARRLVGAVCAAVAAVTIWPSVAVAARQAPRAAVGAAADHSVTGTVTNALTSGAVEGATVDLLEGTAGGVAASGSTSGSGFFTLTVTEPRDDYTLQVTAAGFQTWKSPSPFSAGQEDVTDQDVALTPVYTVTAQVSGPGGTASPADQTVEWGADAKTVTFTPTWSTSSGTAFQIAQVTDSVGGVTANVTDQLVYSGPVARLALTGVAADHAITATFEAAPATQAVTVTPSAAPMGAQAVLTGPSPSGGSARVPLAGPVSAADDGSGTRRFAFAPVPAGSGYEVVVKAVGYREWDSGLFAVGAGGVSVAADLTPLEFTVTATAGENGTVGPASADVTYGGSQALTITPEDHYDIASVTDTSGGVSTDVTGDVVRDRSVTANPTRTGVLTVAGVVADHEVAVTFSYGHTVSGRVSPVPDDGGLAVVRIPAADDGSPAVVAGPVELEQDGTFTLPGVPDGSGYQVAIWADGYEDLAVDAVDVDGDLDLGTVALAHNPSETTPAPAPSDSGGSGGETTPAPAPSDSGGSGGGSGSGGFGGPCSAGGTASVWAVASLGGGAYPPGATPVTCGGTISLHIEPAEGHQLGQIIDNGRDVTRRWDSRTQTYTLAGVDQDHAIWATFDPIDSTADSGRDTDATRTGGTNAGSDRAAAQAPPGPSAGLTGQAVRVQVPVSRVTLAKGRSYELEAAGYNQWGAAERVKFKSGRSRVATVTHTGRIKAKRAGHARIAVVRGHARAVVEVTVLANKPKARAATVKTLRATAPTRLAAGQDAYLTCELGPATALTVPIRFTSLNPAVATVDKAGRLRALAPGTATITVKAGKASKKLTLTVG